MNSDAIRKQLVGPGPFIIRTSDGKEFTAQHGEFVGITRHYMIVEDENGGVDMVDPMHVVSIRPVRKRRKPVAG